MLENSISEMADLSLEDTTVAHGALSSSPPWWSAALTLGHLETRMHSAKVLDSPTEFKLNLHLYAKRIADEGFRAKAEELMKELCGPLYWCGTLLCCDQHRMLTYLFDRKPSREETWNPLVLGMSKRELLKDVMGIFGMCDRCAPCSGT